MSKADVNYINYHKQINKAERYYFIEHNYQAASLLYRKVFNEYGFIFSRDCLIASQISLLEKNIIDFKFFIEKGFENGIKLDQLNKINYYDENFHPKRVEIFDTILSNTHLKSALLLLYNEKRKIYLQRINKKLLLLTTENYIQDQLNKNIRITQKEKDSTRRKLYTTLIKNNFSYYDSIINKIGFILEKKIGISQKGILSEFGYKFNDIENYYKLIDEQERKIKNISSEQFESDDNSFTNFISFTQMIHFTPFYFIYEKKLLEGIKNGEIHPREVAVLSDFTMSDDEQSYNRKSNYTKKYFNYNFPQYINKDYHIMPIRNRLYDENEIAKVDSIRKIIYVNDYEIDIAKRELEISKGIKLLSFGFFWSL